MLSRNYYAIFKPAESILRAITSCYVLYYYKDCEMIQHIIGTLALLHCVNCMPVLYNETHMKCMVCLSVYLVVCSRCF